MMMYSTNLIFPYIDKLADDLTADNANRSGECTLPDTSIPYSPFALT